MALEIEGAVVIDQAVMERFFGAFKTGRWMVAIWHVDGKDLHFYRKTFEFPFEDFPEALRQLAVDLEREAGPLPESDLRQASPEPLRMFSGLEEKAQCDD